jgi:uncharacterized protein (DUF1330 family)
MAKKPAIDPEKHYTIAFSAVFEHGGRKYIPRDGQKVRLKGSVVEAIVDKIDGYEEV